MGQGNGRGCNLFGGDAKGCVRHVIADIAHGAIADLGVVEITRIQDHQEQFLAFGVVVNTGEYVADKIISLPAVKFLGDVLGLPSREFSRDLQGGQDIGAGVFGFGQAKAEA